MNKQKLEQPTERNWVAKNASATTKSAAGAHKDQKKAAKKGDIKHKNKDYFENLEALLAEKLSEGLSAQDKKDVDAIKAAIKRLQNELNDPNPNVDKENIKQRIATEKKRLGLYGLDEHIVKVKGGYELKSKKTGKNLGKYPTRAGAKNREREVQYFKHANESKDIDQGEYSDEVGMVKGNLHTIIRMCKALDDHMISDENLPEWVEEKVSQAKAMIVSAGDYIISQHEIGNIQKIDNSDVDENWKGQDFAYPLPVKEGKCTLNALADKLVEYERTYVELLERKFKNELKKYL